MKRISLGVALTLTLSCAALAGSAGAQSSEPATTIVSRSGNDSSEGCDVAREGRAVAFTSAASDLVTGDTNGVWDVFLASGGGIERVSVTSREMESEVSTYGPSISDEGTRVAFKSRFSRLTGPLRRPGQHFVRDTAAGVTERVIVAADGGRADRGSSGAPEISGDGRVVAFHSSAGNLTPRRDRDGNSDVFVRMLASDTTERASVAPDRALPDLATLRPVVSTDGRFVAFTSAATNLVRDDDNREFDVFRHDRKTGRTIRVNVASDGTEATYPSFGPALSADGRYVAFETGAALVSEDTNGVYDVYVHDVLTGVTELVSRGASGPGVAESHSATMSDDGRYVAFLSPASNLVAGDTNSNHPGYDGIDVFVRDRVEEETTRVSVGDQGQEANDDSRGAAISPDGDWVCWSSYASNLVPGDDNAREDVFLRGPLWAEEE